MLVSRLNCWHSQRPIKAQTDTAWVTDWLRFVLIGPLSITTQHAHCSKGLLHVTNNIKLFIYVHLKSPAYVKMDTDVKLPEKWWVNAWNIPHLFAAYAVYSFLHVKTWWHRVRLHTPLVDWRHNHFIVLWLAMSCPTLSFWLINNSFIMQHSEYSRNFEDMFCVDTAAEFWMCSWAWLICNDS